MPLTKFCSLMGRQYSVWVDLEDVGTIVPLLGCTPRRVGQPAPADWNVQREIGCRISAGAVVLDIAVLPSEMAEQVAEATGQPTVDLTALTAPPAGAH